jgi:hypothetical protein
MNPIRSTIFCMLIGVFAPLNASAAPINVTPGLWRMTDLLRNFVISADGKKEIENGGSGPNTENICVTAHSFDAGSIYPGSKIPSVAKLCKFSTISETPSLIDSVAECGGGIAHITHTLVLALTPKSITTIQETTFTDPLANGSVSRSTINVRGKWLKESCGR